ncbi:unnamed protein product [Gordionus sp. m RMFG-2023]
MLVHKNRLNQLKHIYNVGTALLFISIIIPSIFITILLSISHIYAEENDLKNITNFYEILNVTQDATKRDIRKAFKKLALEKHPDKNTGNENAHEIFLKINKAYTVLSDDGQREIYDRAGEAGLSDNNQDYETYVSSTTDDAVVSGNGEHWFIDFYSAMCSHCRELAPAWKQLAARWQGVIHIAAVNCLEEWNVCVRQALTSYPTLILFPKRERFPSFASSSLPDLHSFLVEHVPRYFIDIEDLEFNDNSLKEGQRSFTLSTIKNDNVDLFNRVLSMLTSVQSRATYLTSNLLIRSEEDRTPCIIFFCETSLDRDDIKCPSDMSMRRFSKTFFGSINVLYYKCLPNKHLACVRGKFSTWYFPSGLTDSNNFEGSAKITLDYTYNILHILDLISPDANIHVEKLSDDENIDLDNFLNTHLTNFLWGQISNIEVINVDKILSIFNGYLDSSNIYNPKLKQVNIESLNSPLILICLFKPLNNSELSIPNKIQNFLNQLKKLKFILRGMHLITTDGIKFFNCYENDAHMNYCKNVLGVTRSPTSSTMSVNQKHIDAVIVLIKSLIPFNSASISFSFKSCYHIFYGDIDKHIENSQSNSLITALTAFVKDSLISPVISVKPSDLIGYKEKSIQSDYIQYWIVDYFTPWCPPCMRLLSELNKASRSKFPEPAIKILWIFASLDCVEFNLFCQAEMHIYSYPSLRLYNFSMIDPLFTENPLNLEGFKDSETIKEYIEEIIEPLPIILLTPEIYQYSILSQENNALWFIYFGAKWCGPCLQFEPVWKKLSKELKKSQIGTMDCGVYKDYCREVNVRTFPRIRVYLNFSYFNDYPDDAWRDLTSVKNWATKYIPSNIVILTPEAIMDIEKNILHKHGDSKPWIIDYYTNWCGHCSAFAPEFDELQNRMGKILNFGKIDCAIHEFFCQEQNVPHYPTIRLYYSQNFKDLNSMTANDLESEIFKEFSELTKESSNNFNIKTEL